jgi:membrane fusion protein, multidrug efflux system
MKKIILNTITISLLISGCGNKNGNKKISDAELLTKLKKEQQAAQKQIAALQAKVSPADSGVAAAIVSMPMMPSSFISYIDVQGNVDAENTVVANPEMPGVIQKIFVHVGQFVSKGQTIATLKTSQVAGISDGIIELEQQISFARVLYEKQQRLWKQEIGTEVQLLGARNNYEALVKKRNSLNNQISTSKKMLSIIAPTSGIVDAVDITEGSAVAPGMPIGIRIVNTTALKVKAPIAENYGSLVTTGDQVLLVFDDIQDSVYTRIGYVTKVIDPISRTFKAEIPLPNNGKFRPNMVAKVRIVGYRNDRAFVLPAGLIQRNEKGDFVYTVADDGTAKITQIKAGQSYEGRIEILEGLNLGQKVITTGFEDLNEGDKVTENVN